MTYTNDIEVKKIGLGESMETVSRCLPGNLRRGGSTMPELDGCIPPPVYIWSPHSVHFQNAEHCPCESVLIAVLIHFF